MHLIHRVVASEQRAASPPAPSRSAHARARACLHPVRAQVTPTFRLFRNGVLLDSCTGVKNEGEAIVTNILRHLKEDEAGAHPTAHALWLVGTGCNTAAC